MSKQTKSSLTQQLTQHYVPLLEKHGSNHQAVNWGSPKSQRKRFEILLEPFLQMKNSFSLLDVGCGLAHLFDYIKENNFKIDYTGVDAIPQMIELAKLNHPEISSCLYVSSVSDIKSEKFDVIVASGIFYIACDEERMQSEIHQLFNQCNIGLAFNSLSTWANKKEENEFYVDPVSFLSYCKSLTRRCILRHDYMSHDFTMHLFPEFGNV